MTKSRTTLLLLLCAAALTFPACSSENKTESNSTPANTTAKTESSAPDDSSDDTLDDFDDYGDDSSDIAYLYDDYDYGDWWGVDGDYEGDFSQLSEDNTGINWDNIPRITNDDEAKQYFIDCANQLMTTIPVCYGDGYSLSTDQFLVITSLPWVNENVYSNGDDIYLTYDVIYYPGTRIATAYLNDDTSELSDEEMQVYNIAVDILDRSAQYDTALKQELFIHDQICESVTYYTESLDAKMPRFCTAIGVFVDGKANCQGYSDAFYMLMKMAGFEVGKQTGYANDGGHVWNVVNYQGVWSAVDLTWNDDVFSLNDMSFVVYTYFNVGADIISNSHSWDSYAEIYPITTQTDGSYFYYTPEADNQFFGQHTSDIDTMASFIANQLMTGDPFIYVKGNGFITDANEIGTMYGNILASNNFGGKTNVFVQTLGNDCFVYVDAAVR